MKRLYLFFSAILIVLAGKAQLFQQNFQSSTTLGNYSAINPTSGQFNEIYDNDATNDMVVGINNTSGNNSLLFTRSAAIGGIGGFTRSTDFNPAPQIVKYTFDIRIGNNPGNDNNSVATWFLGSGYINGGTTPSDANVHTKFFLDVDENGSIDRFRFRRPGGGGGTTTSWYNIPAANAFTTITVVVNNSGADMNYTGPNGNNESLGNDEWDLWVGNSIEFDDEAAVTGSVNITDLKFLFNSGAASIYLDNIQLDAITDFASNFYQDFSSSTTFGDYDAGNPGNGQFNEIYDGATGGPNQSNMVISINTTGSNKLRFAKSVDGTNGGAAIGGFTRSTSFTGNPNTMMIEMDLAISGSLNDNNQAAKFYVGEGFNTGGSAPSSGDIHSYFEIDFDDNGVNDQFRIRKGGVGTNGVNDVSAWYPANGSAVRILFVINNSGSAKSYYTPAGTVESLNNDNYVVWIGTTKAFGNNGTATGGGNDLDDFKFYFNDGIGTIDFDNMLMNPIPVANTTVDPQIINAQLNPQFNAQWTQSSPIQYVTGYRLDVATNAGFTNFVSGFQNLYVDGPITLQQLVTGVSLLNDHYIRVRPVYQIGSNEVSGEFSNVTLLTSLEFLPVELSSFTARLVNKSTELKWSTYEELNSSHYDVERSGDGRTFTKVGTVTSKNSMTGSNYQFTDNNPAAGKNYYRLKMVDIDGKFEYSHVVMVTNTAAVRMEAYPNPTRSKVTVQFSKASNGANIKVVSMDGRVMSQLAVPANSTQMDVNLSGMVPGIYTLIFTSNGEQSMKRIQKL